MFRIYDCDFGFTLNSVAYDFEHVDSFVVEDPKFTRLIRGANSSNNEGLVYTEGGKEPETITVTMMGLSADIKALLDSAFKNKTRLDNVYGIDRVVGSSKMAKKAILCQKPQQLNIAEGAESLNVVLTFQSFDVAEVLKS